MDGLQKEVDDILGTISTSGKQVQNYRNKTNTDDLDTSAQDLIAKMVKTVTAVAEIETEMEHFFLT